MIMAEQDQDEGFTKEYTHFFALVGYAITRWAHIDRELFEFFRVALGASAEKAANIFYGYNSISHRLEVADSMMRLSLRRKLLIIRWEKIFKETKEILPVRNDLAHNIPTQVIELAVSKDALSFPIPEPKYSWESRTKSTKLLRKKERKARVKAEEIIAHTTALNKLLDDMRELKQLLPKRLGSSHAKPPKQATPQASDSMKKKGRTGARRQSPFRSSRA